ncbi:MAG: hypothetical protein HUJ77_12225 [Clostridium sp.]|uniref:hypothetical protein n=1 Tax=Clostridium sp. TaxID=1506 RepID=UPI0025BB886D|nr:hypothetical protein [Clostridium sp.]MCF0149148.1 hypothetical protein [Clostridium sp.]
MFVPIELDKTRNFRYGMKAIAYIEDKLNISISKIDLTDLTMKDTAIIICAGLIHEDKELTPDKVMDLIDDKDNLFDVIKAMEKALTASFNGNEKVIEEKN